MEPHAALIKEAWQSGGWQPQFELADALVDVLLRYTQVYSDVEVAVDHLKELSDIGVDRPQPRRDVVGLPPVKAASQWLLSQSRRLAIHRLVQETERTAADRAAFATRLAAAMAATGRRGVHLEVDTWAQALFMLKPSSECLPSAFDGATSVSQPECDAVSRVVVMALMDEPDDMQPGVRALHDALPEEQRHRWTAVRRFLRAQRGSVMTIFNDEMKAEKLDRASRVQFAMLSNERPEYFGVALFHAWARIELYPARLLGGDVMDADTFQRRIQRLLDSGMQIGDLFSLDQCPQAKLPTWSVELNLSDCHLLFSAAVDLSGRILQMREVAAHVHDLLRDALPDAFDRELSTFSLTSPSSGLRSTAVTPFHRLMVVVDGVISLRAPLETLAGELSTMAAQLAAPQLCSRVTSTPNGNAQSAEKAHLKGGDMQRWMAGKEKGTVAEKERRRIAELSVAHRSTRGDTVQYIDHPQPLQDGAIASMAMTVRAKELLGARHGVQRELPEPWPSSRAAGTAAVGPVNWDELERETVD